MIRQKRDAWLESPDCKIGEMITYIEIQGRMRDAQIEAIKTYLFMKIRCKNKPLADLFCEGSFNSLNLNNLSLTANVRSFLMSHPDAAAFYEYVRMMAKTDKSFQKVLKRVETTPESIDYVGFFHKVFFGRTYADYIFSLPMGAGKTFLMAALMYIDLYFSSIEPENPAFAKNFIVLAPSGLKSSIIPSLKTIKKFDPTWVIDPIPAKHIRSEMIFEVLEESSSVKKTYRTVNPNAQKVSFCLSSSDRGLVFVTNAEKVILNKIKDDANLTIDDFLPENGNLNIDDEEKMANELRFRIGTIPNLMIIIDEVHHAPKDNIKLRNVVDRWADKGNVTSVIGFSGTPYNKKPEKIDIGNGMRLSIDEIANVVEFYPLIQGIGNFLKKPLIWEYENRNQELQIVENGLKDFLNRFGNSRYSNGTVPKIAVYCTESIRALEEEAYPVAARIASEYGLDPNIAILKFHGGNKEYKISKEASMEFASLDSPVSKVRIILLDQIGKEGWDCKSLTGVILTTKSKSSKNMVLQTCCRCLRQVERYAVEEARIYLNHDNVKLLEEELKNEQRTTLKEFQEGGNGITVISRYDRTSILGNPAPELYQYRVSTTIMDEEAPNIAANIRNIPLEKMYEEHLLVTKDFSAKVISRRLEDNEYGGKEGNPARYNTWIDDIAKGSFGFLSPSTLHAFDNELKSIFNTITFKSDDVCYFSSKFPQDIIKTKIRESFYAKRTFVTKEEEILDNTPILAVNRFNTRIETTKPELYYPEQTVVEECRIEDLLGFDGRDEMRRQYYYMPYNLGSSLEKNILIRFQEIASYRKLEVCYMGDRFLTDFHIQCYKKIGKKWKPIGRYTPDFLIMERDEDGSFKKIMIVETKGKVFANNPDFVEKRLFVEDFFIRMNNTKAGYNRLTYLYIEDSMENDEMAMMLERSINDFFEVN